eukprot:764389-Hanusia_phi.AAC.1
MLTSELCEGYGVERNGGGSSTTFTVNRAESKLASSHVSNPPRACRGRCAEPNPSRAQAGGLDGSGYVYC